MTLRLSKHNIKVVDFTSLFEAHAESKIMNDLESYNLIKNDTINIKSKDVKKFYYHHIIHDLCDYILSVKGTDRIIIFHCTSQPPGRHHLEYTGHLEFKLFINTFISKLIKILPIKFITSEMTFKQLKRSIAHNQGEGVEATNKIICITDTFDTSKYTFEKARYFAKRYGLEYLSNNFFKKIKNKHLILR